MQSSLDIELAPLAAARRIHAPVLDESDEITLPEHVTLIKPIAASPCQVLPRVYSIVKDAELMLILFSVCQELP